MFFCFFHFFQLFFFFSCFFSFCSFVSFFSLGFRASGVTCTWFSIEKMFLEVIFSLFFSFFVSLFLFFFDFLTKKRKNMKNNEKMCLFFEETRKSYTCCKGVPGAMCCGKLYDSLRCGGILDPSVVRRALSFQFQRSPMSSSANDPLARTAKRHREVDPMMPGMNPILASMFGAAFALLVPTRAESC